MRLKRPPYLEVVGTAGYYYVHAGHRETAINHAISVIREAATREAAALADDPIAVELAAPIGGWVVESLIQGAWMREYHEWEKATKSYFEGQHVRNDGSKPDWKGKLSGVNGAASHVDRVRAQLTLFAASVSEGILAVLDEQRRLINTAKHEDEFFATEQDYRALTQAAADFWNELTTQEEFTPPRQRHGPNQG
jgi:hypothetical protein